ncbi:MAG TPA: iron-containing alcohol dehydrogenase [Streptosporangiaceae bacterium]|nr:iron-containing alcohol dehydrogenase [Streptosporangiaceae bacterium]
MTSAIHPALRRKGWDITADGEFYMPTRVLFGRGIAGQIAGHVTALGADAVLLVTDPGVRAAGLITPVEAALAAAGIAVTIFDQVRPNPRDTDCLAGADLIRAGGQRLVLAVGGGSAMDTAKCVGLLLTNGGHPRDWEDFGALRHDPLPLIAVPTTAGTGSEVSPSAVITDTARKKKMNLFDMRNCPRIALVDPDLTLSCPAQVTAASGMDALSHAVDSLHCRLATPASDALALEGARLVARYIRRAVATPADIEARCGMAQGSLTAGLAVGLTDVSGAHALAEAMGGLYGHPHGYCCAVSMPAIMEYNLPVSADKYARLAVALGADHPGVTQTQLAQAAIAAIGDLNADLGVPPMRDLIKPEDLDVLAAKAEANTSTPSNPRTATAADYRAMFARELGSEGTQHKAGGSRTMENRRL